MSARQHARTQRTRVPAAIAGTKLCTGCSEHHPLTAFLPCAFTPDKLTDKWSIKPGTKRRPPKGRPTVKDAWP